MKKLLVLLTVISLIASMGIVSSFAMHVARDGVETYDENDPKKSGIALAKIGANPDYTDIGDISDKELTAIMITGWYAFEIPIEEFGYRINDEDPVLGSPKFYGTDKDLIDSMAEGLNCAESVRFHIVVPVYIGENIEVTPVAMDEDGYVHDMPWTICYTSTYGVTPEPTAEPTPTKEPTPTPDITPTPTAAPTPEATEAPTAAPEESSGCGSVIGGGFAVLAVMSAAALVLRKKVKE